MQRRSRPEPSIDAHGFRKAGGVGRGGEWPSRTARTTLRVLGALSLCAAAASACGGGGSADQAPAESGGANTPSAAAEAPACDVGSPSGPSCVIAVEGQLRDENGAPIDLPVTVCSATLCFAGESTSGAFRVSIGKPIDLSAFAVHVDGRPARANVLVRLGASTRETVSLEAPVVVPPLTHVGAALPSEAPKEDATITAGPVSLTIAAGTTVKLDFADVALKDEGRLLRSGAIASKDVTVLHALAPFGARFDAPVEAAVTLPAGAFPDGAKVDFIALDDVTSPGVGTLRVVAEGTVEGGVARSAKGTGITRLSWIGVRAKEAP